jgi:hypothetical protein
MPTNNELDVEKGDIHKELKDLNLPQNAGTQSSSTTAANTVSSCKTTSEIAVTR